MCTWDRIEKGALKIRVYWKRVLYVFKSPIKIEEGVSVLYQILSMWPSVSSLESFCVVVFQDSFGAFSRNFLGLNSFPGRVELG